MAAPSQNPRSKSKRPRRLPSTPCCAPTFGDRLRKAMEMHGMSQVEFAEKSGTTPMEINHWIHGRRTPNVTNLAKLVKALKHTRLDWLILGENI